jgi:hypothetical protein
MKLTLHKTAYSSIVGGGIRFIDETGVVRFQIALMGVQNGISKEIDQQICEQIIKALPEGVEVKG